MPLITLIRRHYFLSFTPPWWRYWYKDADKSYFHLRDTVSWHTPLRTGWYCTEAITVTSHWHYAMRHAISLATYYYSNTTPLHSQLHRPWVTWGPHDYCFQWGIRRAEICWYAEMLLATAIATPSHYVISFDVHFLHSHRPLHEWVWLHYCTHTCLHWATAWEMSLLLH